MTEPGAAPDPEGDGRARTEPHAPPTQAGHFDTCAADHAGGPGANGTSNRSVRHEPGIRVPTRDQEATGWPRTSVATRRPPVPAPDTEDGVGWPGEPESPGRGERRPGEPGDRLRARRTTRLAGDAGRGSAALFVGMVLVLVTVGLGAAVWGSGLLTRAPGSQATQPPAVAGPGPTLAGAAEPKTPPASAPAATVVDQGAGTFTEVQSAGPVLGTAGALRRFRIAVENGINEDPNAFATTVDQVLGDPRSWIAGGQFRLQRVPSSAPAEFTIFLASPTTSETMCAVGGLHTDKFTSCRLPGQVIINDARWLTSIPDYGAPLQAYRAYAINHEVGHQLGFGHEACVEPGRSAPVMQQQTYGLTGCVANAWPYVNGQRYAGPPIP
jgi:hypothetical protein